ncbi:MAG TPA: hypothetical protein VJA47_04690 [archaeon]|nr:hypothetical protein [archaeon]
MPGEDVPETMILTAGSIMVVIIVLVLFTYKDFVPGSEAHKINEDAALGYQLVNIVNILSVNEIGNITVGLDGPHRVEVVEGDKTKLIVGKGEFDLLVPVKPNSFISKKGIIVSKSKEGIEILNFV